VNILIVSSIFETKTLYHHLSSIFEINILYVNFS